ncbi:hypothetical protein GQX73_g8898 [Xylaria multiplex]|uniref:DUF676 domain-containing protein n=1 Tax=Xylaria multiplex TaxID=323545 RepID=A0A7C8IN48_9PEZI|nr:hypothetical protein GQX73_g8898 [Xylaria multiplex]
MTTPRLKSFTWRLSQIPEETSKDDILNYFDTDDRERIKVISLYPDASELGKLTATLLFKPNPDQPFDSPKRLPTAPEDIEIDKEFEGLTTLYCPPRGQVIAADVIAITGLTGHAFGSWAKSENFMWLRDFASKFGPSTRVLTYGYDTRLEGIDTSMTILADQAKAFLGQIKFSREARKCQKRPIIFIGHSLGCLLIKRVGNAMVEARDQYFALPVHAIIFMAAPHRGMNIKALEALVQGEPPQTLVRELERGSPTLQDLAERFPRVLGDIPVLTVFETKKTQTVEKAQEPYALIISDFGLTECQGPDGKWVRSGERVFMVESHSAKEYSQNERQICSNENHSSIAKLARNSNNIVFNSLRAFIAEILPKSIDALDSVCNYPLYIYISKYADTLCVPHQDTSDVFGI